MKKHDYRVAKTLHAQGIPLSEISRQTGLPYAALSKFAARNGWEKDRLKAEQAVVERTRKTLAERAAQHVDAISALVDNAITVLSAKPIETLKLSEIEVLSRCTDVFDKIARRAYGLDHQEANGPATLVQVVVEQPGSVGLRRAENPLKALEAQQ